MHLGTCLHVGALRDNDEAVEAAKPIAGLLGVGVLPL